MLRKAWLEQQIYLYLYSLLNPTKSQEHITTPFIQQQEQNIIIRLPLKHTVNSHDSYDTWKNTVTQNGKGMSFSINMGYYTWWNRSHYIWNSKIENDT